MEKSTAAIWHDVFANWPPQFRRKGVLIPSYGEAIPFSDFVMTQDLVVLERPTPDSVGARRVAVPFQLIEGLKYVEPLKTEQFLNNGFSNGVESDGPPARARRLPVKPAPPAPTPNQRR